VKYFPTPDDIEEHLPEILAGNLSVVAKKLNTTQQNLEALLERNPQALDLMRDARAELEALLELRLLTMAPLALDALEEVLLGQKQGKLAMASVQAAREVLDRNRVTAKISRNADTGHKDGAKVTALPPLEELLENTDPDNHMAVVDRYMLLMAEVDHIRDYRIEVVSGDADETRSGAVSSFPDEDEAAETQ
jgi:hypothetical protein